MALVGGILISGVILIFSPGWLYSKLSWSQWFWESIFPPLPYTSAPSGGCLLGMIGSNAVFVAPFLYLFLTFKWNKKPISN